MTVACRVHDTRNLTYGTVIINMLITVQLTALKLVKTHKCELPFDQTFSCSEHHLLLLQR